ncbi:hypothetical protein [Enterococcus italicus]|uniref:hypothetical protein n=1 Tax=Enterococcus italicus TaxID=246144 RepID=UPI003FA21D98
MRTIKNSSYLQTKFRMRPTKRIRQIELNERLVQVIEQQQALIERLAEEKVVSDKEVKK